MSGETKSRSPQDCGASQYEEVSQRIARDTSNGGTLEQDAPQLNDQSFPIQSRDVSIHENETEHEIEQQEQMPSWHPFWLRPITLALLCSCLLAVTITLPLMLYFSRRNDGLAKASDDFVYVWRFGPTGRAQPQILSK